MIRLAPLTGHHDPGGFQCGSDVLDTWLKQTALQHQTKGVSRTFVAIPCPSGMASDKPSTADASEVIKPSPIFGFYALAAALATVDDMPATLAKRFARHIPVTRLGRLAVRADLQGQGLGQGLSQGLGQLLPSDAISRSRNAAQAVGSAGIMVDAKDQNAARFYQRYGFIPCGRQPLVYFMPMW